MTNTRPTNAGALGASRHPDNPIEPLSADDNTILPGEREFATKDERKVLALEMIADQLQLIVECLRDETPCDLAGTASLKRSEIDERASDSWENEGGPSLAAAAELKMSEPQ